MACKTEQPPAAVWVLAAAVGVRAGATPGSAGPVLPEQMRGRDV